MRCCGECFGDRGLLRNIIPSRTSRRGQCPYCRTKDVLLVQPIELREYFELLISSYKQDSAGRTLIRCFREDWSLFTHSRMDDTRTKALLTGVLDGGQVLRRRFLPLAMKGTDALGRWQKLRDELMHRNRFFPNANIDLDRLEALLVHLNVDSSDLSKRWFRARIQAGDSPFQISEMSAPPAKAVSFGRANPAGIPYLYLASSLETAVSEIRPHTGEIVDIAAFKTPNNLKLIDLRHPRSTVSPFVLEDIVDIGRMRNDLPFLERLGEELTRPVIPKTAAIDYTPSQYLCEFIKKCRYDGVIYRSSVGEGMNLALFDPAVAKGEKDVVQRVVERVSVVVRAT
jgi:RES domain